MESKSPPVQRPPAKSRLVQMKAQAVAPRVSRSQTVQKKRANGVVQMTPCNIHRVENCRVCGRGLAGLLSGSVIDVRENIVSYLSNQDVANVSVLSQAHHGLARMDLDRRYRMQYVGTEELPEGVFTCTYVRQLHLNWADLHVQGELGGSIDNSHLISILTKLYTRMKFWHELAGVSGFLEWHPTGAVVTKQVVELLACSLGGGLKVGYALACQKWRKFREKGKRNKFVQLIDEDILPEFFAFLDSLIGVPGIKIIGVFMNKPSYYEHLSNVDKQKFKEQSMLEDNAQGEERYRQFKSDYPKGQVPSLKVVIDYKLIPKLIHTIQSQKK